MLVEAGVRSCKQVIIYDEKKGMADIWAESVPLLGQKNMETLVSVPRLLNSSYADY